MRTAGLVVEGELLWEPSEERKVGSNLARYMGWLGEERGLRFDGYDDLWRWSVEDLDGFWGSIWEYFGVMSDGLGPGSVEEGRWRRGVAASGVEGYRSVLSGREMPGARWFKGAGLNYAEHALRRRDGHAALLSRSELRPMEATSYRDLRERVGAVAAGLRRLGVRKGDRVAALMPNIAETVVALLATASLGAVWSACSPEFGTRSVVDRFRQIKPKVLLAVDGYRYGGRDFRQDRGGFGDTRAAAWSGADGDSAVPVGGSGSGQARVHDVVG